MKLVPATWRWRDDRSKIFEHYVSENQGSFKALVRIIPEAKWDLDALAIGIIRTSWIEYL